MRNASTVGEAPKRQARVISTATPASGLNTPNALNVVAARAVA